jgi:hypothetical protein
MKILLGDFNAKLGREDICKVSFARIIYMKMVMIMMLE